MDCSEIKSRLTLFEEGELPEAERRETEAHLAACATCARLRRDLQKTWRLLDEIPAADPDPFAMKRFFSGFEGKHRAPRKPLYAAAAAAALLLVVGAGWYFHPASGGDSGYATLDLSDQAFSQSAIFPSVFSDSASTDNYYPDVTFGNPSAALTDNTLEMSDEEDSP